MHEFAKYLEKNDFRNSTHDSQDKKEIPFWWTWKRFLYNLFG
jgi:hypothetical protein